MLDRQHPRHRLPRLVLFLAGLLYLLGTAAEPLLHAYAAEGQGREVVLLGNAEEGPQPSAPLLPHHDAGCLVCKLGGPLLLDEAGALLVGGTMASASVFALFGCSRAPPAFLTPQPRAPPLA
jgi:hypothetical protein